MALSGSIQLRVQATSVATRDLSITTDPLVATITHAFTNGTGANQASLIWHDERTLSTGANENIDLYDFAGATTPIGETIANAKIFALIIYNKTTTAGYDLLVGGLAATTAWNSAFNGDDEAKLVVGPGGLIALVAPAAAGYAVADTSNHLLKIDNQSAGSVTYQIIAIGAPAA